MKQKLDKTVKKTLAYLEKYREPTEQEIRKWKRDKRNAEIKSLFHPIGILSLKAQEFLIEGVLPEGYLIILAGPPKSGKTSIATAFALSVALGKTFAEKNVQKAPVLWLSLEESPLERVQLLEHNQEVRKQAKKYKRMDFLELEEDGGRVGIPIYTCFEPIAIDSEKGLYALESWVHRTGAKLIVIDPLHCAHSGRSLTDGWAARKTLQRLKTFCRDKNVTALVLHHTPASGNIRVAENPQLSATASMFMLLSITPSPLVGEGRGEGSDKRIVTLICRGRGLFANQTHHFENPLPLIYHPAEAPKLDTGTVLNIQAIRREQADEAILKFLEKKPHQSTSDIAKAVGANLGTLRNNITRLTGEKKICVSKFAIGGISLYSLAIPESVNDERERREPNEPNEPSEPNERREPNEPNESNDRMSAPSIKPIP